MLSKRKIREEDNFLEILCRLKVYKSNFQVYNYTRFEKNILCEELGKILFKTINRIPKFNNYQFDDMSYDEDCGFFTLCYDEFKTDSKRKDFLDHLVSLGKYMIALEILNTKFILSFELINIQTFF